MADIGVCVTVFKRIEKLDSLLHSIDPDFISKVYVADDGEWTEKKAEVYDQDFSFNLEVFDLEFDAGLGAGRDKIVQESDEDYLLLMDSDMQMPKNVNTLLTQLESDSNLGGVCGLFVEKNRIFTSGCVDIYEDDAVCDLAIRDKKSVEFLANHPLIRFDMIANAALFRRECLDEYSWDPEYVIGREHVDFYMGHKRNTDWEFGLCPSVLFPHNPGGSDDFLKHRWSDSKYDEAERYFLEKWNLNELDSIDQTWLDTYNPDFGGFPPFGIIPRVNKKVKEDGVFQLMCSILNRLYNKMK